MIIEAYKDGDVETLCEIRRLGIKYRPPRPARPFEPSVSTTRASASDQTRWFSKNWLATLRPLWFPLSLLFAIRSWHANSKLFNAACIAGASIWAWLGLLLWNELNALSTWSQDLGHGRESLAAFGILALRLLFLTLVLPVAIPLGLTLLRMAWLIGCGWIAQWVIAGIAGYFHPYLWWIATFAICGAVAVTLWRTLDEW